MRRAVIFGLCATLLLAFSSVHAATEDVQHVTKVGSFVSVFTQTRLPAPRGSAGICSPPPLPPPVVIVAVPGMPLSIPSHVLPSHLPSLLSGHHDGR